MTRLNQTKRKQIVQNALKKAGVLSRKAALKERKAKLAEDIYYYALGGKDRYEQINALFVETREKYSVPTELEPFVTSNVYLKPKQDYEIYAAFGGRQMNLQFNGEDEPHRPNQVYRPFWSSMGSNRQLFAVDHKFSLEFDAIEKEHKTIADIEEATTAQVSAVVNSVNTYKQLLNVWPEASELLPAEEKVSTGTGLQVNVESLNTLLNLPSEEKGA